MVDKEQLNDFINLMGIELLPYQQTLLEKMATEEKIYICVPKNQGLTFARQIIETIIKDKEEL